MTYMMLLHGDESAWQGMPEEAQSQAIAAFMEYNGELAAAGILAGGGELQPSYTATTLRGTDGGVQVVDGPFAETKEQIRGFYLLNVPDLDSALKWAKRCPSLYGGGVIEVRPLGTVPSELDSAGG